MALEIIAVIGIAVVIVQVLLGIPIVYAMMISAIGIIVFGLQQPASLAKLGMSMFTQFYSMNWTPLPLFILLAYIINETTIAKDIFGAANKWLSHVRGGLVVSGIVGEAVMSAAIGSSGITILAVGKVALPEMERLNYKKNFSIGALLAGGVLGPLIPPSIPFITYGILTQESIGKLLIAGVVPGILLTILLALTTIVLCTKNRDWAPLPPNVSWKERFSSIARVWPILLVLVGIIGSIYAGIATATESAAVGVIVALVIAVTSYGFRFKNLMSALTEAATVTAMIGLMVVAASVFTFSIGVSGLAQNIANSVTSAGLSPWLVIIAINIIILIAGCIMDTLAIVLVTVPIFTPIITSLGFDPIWFGVVMVVNMEIGLLTPPIGLNTFITSQLFKISVIDLLKGALPFVIVLFGFLALIIAVPEISTWLPGLMK